MKKETEKIIYYCISLVVSAPAWIYVFYTDWKLGLMLILIFWGNNLTLKANNL